MPPIKLDALPTNPGFGTFKLEFDSTLDELSTSLSKLGVFLESGNIKKLFLFLPMKLWRCCNLLAVGETERSWTGLFGARETEEGRRIIPAPGVKGVLGVVEAELELQVGSETNSRGIEPELLRRTLEG